MICMTLNPASLPLNCGAHVRAVDADAIMSEPHAMLHVHELR